MYDMFLDGCEIVEEKATVFGDFTHIRSPTKIALLPETNLYGKIWEEKEKW